MHQPVPISFLQSALPTQTQTSLSQENPCPVAAPVFCALNACGAPNAATTAKAITKGCLNMTCSTVFEQLNAGPARAYHNHKILLRFIVSRQGILLAAILERQEGAQCSEVVPFTRSSWRVASP